MTPERIALVVSVVLGLSVSARAETIQVTIDKLVFAPAEVNAKVGDTIEWINKDALVHTATATNGDWNVNIRGKPARAGRAEKTGRGRLLLQASSQHEGTDCRSALKARLEHLARIEDAVGVEHALEAAHELERDRILHFRQRVRA